MYSNKFNLINVFFRITNFRHQYYNTDTITENHVEIFLLNRYAQVIFITLFTFTGCWGNLHWQEMPLCWKRQHPWKNSHWYYYQNEDEPYHCNSSWLPSLCAQVQPFWETSQEYLCSSQSLLPVIITLLKYNLIHIFLLLPCSYCNFNNFLSNQS